MKKEEKQHKFHEALLKMLYPPPPSQAQEDEEGKLKNSTDLSYYLPDAGEVEDNSRNSSSSSSDENSGEKGGSEKLTRSQRKRLRKRKFKESASRRREIIGPLLPNSKDGGVDSVGKTLQSVRHNTASGSNTVSVTNNSGAPAFCTKKNKMKQRRKAKKVYC